MHSYLTVQLTYVCCRQVVFENDCYSPVPMVQHRTDKELVVKFEFRNVGAAAFDDNAITGDMVALYDVEEMSSNGGSLANPKAVAHVAVGTASPGVVQSVTFKRKYTG